jgi:hypothetical protein
MRLHHQLVLAMLATLSLAACTDMTDPNPSKPITMPNGKTYYPPPGGWPSYDKAGESGRG